MFRETPYIQIRAGHGDILIQQAFDVCPEFLESKSIVSDSELTFSAINPEILVCETSPVVKRLIESKGQSSISPGRWIFITAIGTIYQLARHIFEAVPLEVCFPGEDVSRTLSGVIRECLVIDAGIDSFPWETSSPKAHLSLSNAVFKEGPRVEHMCMPNHQDV